MWGRRSRRRADGPAPADPTAAAPARAVDEWTTLPALPPAGARSAAAVDSVAFTRGLTGRAPLAKALRPPEHALGGPGGGVVRGLRSTVARHTEVALPPAPAGHVGRRGPGA